MEIRSKKSRAGISLLAVVFVALGIALAMSFYFAEKEEPRHVGTAPESVAGGDESSSMRSSPAIFIQTRTISPSPYQADQSKIVGIVRVTFPNGDAVDVMLRNFEPELPSPANFGTLMDAYDTLSAAAGNGDGPAARHLYRSLRRCENVFVDALTLEFGLEQFRRTGKLTYPNSAEASMAPGLSTYDVEEAERQKFKFCRNVPRELVESRNYWAEKAAEAGDFLGSRDHVKNIGLFTKEGFDTYQTLWSNGHLSAVQGLALITQRGYESEAGPTPPDLVQSYTYTLISSQILAESLRRNAPGGRPVGPNAANRIAMMDQVLAAKAAMLTAEQLEYAAIEAVRLIEENPNCCLGRW